jgi:hypothetical protein
MNISCSWMSAEFRIKIRRFYRSDPDSDIAMNVFLQNCRHPIQILYTTFDLESYYVSTYINMVALTVDK